MKYWFVFGCQHNATAFDKTINFQVMQEDLIVAEKTSTFKDKSI